MYKIVDTLVSHDDSIFTLAAICCINLTGPNAETNDTQNHRIRNK